MSSFVSIPKITCSASTPNAKTYEKKKTEQKPMHTFGIEERLNVVVIL